jgi:hypothetical protein
MWIKNPSELFGSLELIPSEGDSASDMFNKLSRLLIVLSLVVWWKYPDYLEKFILYGLIVIMAIYVIQNNPSPRQKKKEKFSPLTYKMDASTQPHLPEMASMAHAQSLALVPPSAQPVVNQPMPVASQPVMSQPISVQPMSSQPMINQPVMSQPVSVQPMSSQPVMSQTMSSQPMINQPVSVQPVMAHPASIQPKVYPQASVPIQVQQPSVQSLIEPMSIPKESTPITGVSGQSVVYVSKELLPVEEKVTPIQHLPRQPTVTELQRSLSKPPQMIPQEVPRMVSHQSFATSLPQAMTQVQADQDWLRPPQKFYTPNVGVNTKMYQAPILAPRMMDTDFSDIQTNQPVNFNPLQDMGMKDERKAYAPKKNRALLLEKTEEESCLPSSTFVQGNNKFYMQDIQPNVYSFTYDPTPINSNIGITYAPQNPPLQRVNMCTPDGKNYPVFTRIDPQLIREDVHPQRREELPSRGPWSEKYGDFEASTSTDGVTSIYDPRFTGYGDEYRSYHDVNLGNVKYYYTDVDAYRNPNFVVRNKVDHVDMKQPMGDIYSSYPREASLEDVREIVNNDWMAKSMEHREDLMAQQMTKSNRRNWQMRYAPRSRGANLSTFSSGY